MRPTRGLLLIVLGAAALASYSAASGRDAAAAYVRLDQVGYAQGDVKHARLLSPAPAAHARFEVLDGGGGRVAQGRVGRDLGRWSRSFPHVYAIDFSRVRSPGTYSIEVSGPAQARSPPFRIDASPALFGPLAANAVRFLSAQRDGPDVDPAILDRRPSHLADGRSFIYATPAYRHDRLVGRLRRVGGPIDVSGGWMDAGDTLKYAETASFSEALLLYSLRRYPATFGERLAAARAEARFGMDWLLEIWRPASGTLVYQVGLGSGNGATILGDHDTTWRLPQADDALKAPPGSESRYVKYRPAFRAGRPGAALSPNLAGRMAAAFALGAQVFRPLDGAYAKRCLAAARSIFARAATHHVKRLVTAAPHDFYPETEWRDDMELGAAELSLATVGVRSTSRRYLHAAAHWANAYAGSKLNGTDSFNLYDVSALAHDELFAAMRKAGLAEIDGVSRGSLVGDLRGQMRLAVRAAARDPFSLGIHYRDDDTVAHALGLVSEAGFVDELSHSTRYADFGTAQRDFALGDNAWGLSFVVGAGTTFPHCLHDPVANLNGSLDGSPPVMLGAVAPGPVTASDLRGLSLSKGYRRCPPDGGNPFGRFDGAGARYEDDVLASPTNEPSLDVAALAMLAFAREASR
jgi:endoglucanase